MVVAWVLSIGAIGLFLAGAIRLALARGRGDCTVHRSWPAGMGMILFALLAGVATAVMVGAS